nr:MAG TPA: hypothetical protein [Caudoviricetes sp.]
MQKCDLCIYFIQNGFTSTTPFCISKPKGKVSKSS